MTKTTLDPYRDILGLDLPPDRLAEILEAYGDILAALQDLRRLDLTDVHPAVVFDPLVTDRPGNEE